MRRKLMLIAIAVSSLSISRSFAEHTMVTPADITWGEAPPTLPAGAKMAVLYGDPGKTGLFVIRLKTSAGYKIPAHWHPTDENITVVSGTFMMGMADKLDPRAAKPMPAGSFMTMPANTHHFAMTKSEAVVEVTSMGPFVITYVNPDDDPTTKKHTLKE